MIRFVLIVAVVACTTVSAASQTRRPAFSTYTANVERARVKKIDFRNNSEARTFRTRLSEALLGGVNFAGHYVVAGWGCGTGCISGAIIDARNGKVYWPLPMYALSVWWDGENYADKPIDYQKNSRLVILRGSPGVKDSETEKPNGEYFYEWRNNSLKLIKFIPYKSKAK